MRLRFRGLRVELCLQMTSAKHEWDRGLDNRRKKKSQLIWIPHCWYFDYCCFPKILTHKIFLIKTHSWIWRPSRQRQRIEQLPQSNKFQKMYPFTVKQPLKPERDYTRLHWKNDRISLHCSQQYIDYYLKTSSKMVRFFFCFFF